MYSRSMTCSSHRERWGHITRAPISYKHAGIRRSSVAAAGGRRMYNRGCTRGGDVRYARLHHSGRPRALRLPRATIRPRRRPPSGPAVPRATIRPRRRPPSGPAVPRATIWPPSAAPCISRASDVWWRAWGIRQGCRTISQFTQSRRRCTLYLAFCFPRCSFVFLV